MSILFEIFLIFFYYFLCSYLFWKYRMIFLYFTQFYDMLPVLRRRIPFGQLLTVIFPVCPEIISTCAVAIQWLVCMQAIAMQTGHWISNPLPNEQNAAANADARARKREFCECGSGFDARMSIQPHRWKSFRTASLKSAFLPNPSRKKLLPIYNCTSTQKTKYVLDLKALTILRQMMSMASPMMHSIIKFASL